MEITPGRIDQAVQTPATSKQTHSGSDQLNRDEVPPTVDLTTSGIINGERGSKQSRYVLWSARRAYDEYRYYKERESTARSLPIRNLRAAKFGVVTLAYRQT
ncbi:hypothetical protein M758_10G113100 [Ceratodon purpureus]|nr:hypothetical protein M758_10G113100 [Ceratodon purpureus]